MNQNTTEDKKYSELTIFDTFNEPKYCDLKITFKSEAEDGYVIFASKNILCVCESLGIKFDRWTDDKSPRTPMGHLIIEIDNTDNDRIIEPNYYHDLFAMIYGGNVDINNFLDNFVPNDMFFNETLTYFTKINELAEYFEIKSRISIMLNSLMSKHNVGFDNIEDCCINLSELITNDENFLKSENNVNMVRMILSTFISRLIFGDKLYDFFNSIETKDTLEWISENIILRRFLGNRGQPLLNIDPFMAMALIAAIGNNNRTTLGLDNGQAFSGLDLMQVGRMIGRLRQHLLSCDDEKIRELAENMIRADDQDDAEIPTMKVGDFADMLFSPFNGQDNNIDTEMFQFKIMGSTLQEYFTKNLDQFIAITISEQSKPTKMCDEDDSDDESSSSESDSD